MTVKATEMVKAVRVAIDMNTEDTELKGAKDSDTLELDEIIMSKLADAVRIVELEAPAHLLESGHDFSEKVFVYANGKGYAILPHDFMRLICFRMSDWERGVYEAISERDATYSLMSSRHRGVSGSVEKPIAAIVRRSEGKVLEFAGSANGEATCIQAAYLPYPEIDDEGNIDLAEECYQSAIYRAASLALASVGDQLSTTMLEISKSLLSE